MKDNLLFVSRNPAVTQEFLEAMKDCEFEIDTIENGQQAVEILQKKEYKVVITGMNLSSFDGNKLIAWLNENCPQTACIVYTTRMDLAELRLLVNERNVFRIFLKPANYRGDFYNAIVDGFSYYDICSTQQEQQKMLEKKRENAIFTIVQMKEAAEETEEEREKLKQFLFPLIRLSMKEFGPQVTKKERADLLKYEEDIINFYFKKNYRPCNDIEEIKEKMQQEFVKDGENQKISIRAESNSNSTPPGFMETLHFLVWITAHQIAKVSKSYEIEVQIGYKSSERVVVQVQGHVPTEILQQFKSRPNEKFFLELVRTIVENMTDKCRREVEKGRIYWEMELRMDGKCFDSN